MLVEELERWQPTVLATYPGMAWILAQEKAAGHLRCAPEAVWTGGETLSPVLQRAIDKAFGCPVRNSYGASECMAIANECRSGALHLNADWVMLEPVDAQFRPVPQGEVGSTTLLTNLANHLQPIIRYDLGDRVRFVRCRTRPQRQAATRLVRAAGGAAQGPRNAVEESKRRSAVTARHSARPRPPLRSGRARRGAPRGAERQHRREHGSAQQRGRGPARRLDGVAKGRHVVRQAHALHHRGRDQQLPSGSEFSLIHGASRSGASAPASARSCSIVSCNSGGRLLATRRECT